MTRCDAQGDAGFSLLELVAVLAVYAVIAIMSLQLLSGAATSRARIAEVSTVTEEAAAALAVLRRDLGVMVPVAEAGQRAIRFAEGTVAFETPLGRDAGIAVQSVEWRLDPAARTLIRQTDAGAQVMLSDVSGLHFRILAGQGGWIPGPAWTPRHPADLPRGIEAVIEAEASGTLRVVVAR